jgi:hypothetical protein
VETVGEVGLRIHAEAQGLRAGLSMSWISVTTTAPAARTARGVRTTAVETSAIAASTVRAILGAFFISMLLLGVPHKVFAIRFFLKGRNGA